MTSTHLKAVIFDVRSFRFPTCQCFLDSPIALHTYIICDQIGGVVLRSPLIAIAAYEREHGMPVNYINCSMFVHTCNVYVFGTIVDRVALEQSSKRLQWCLAKI